MKKGMNMTLWIGIVFVAGLAIAEPNLWPDSARVLQQRLEGTWQPDESLTKRLTGTPGSKIVKFVIKVDNSVLAQIPESRKKDFPAPPYIAGSTILSSKGKPDVTRAFVVFDQGGSHIMTLLSDREGEPYGQADSGRIVLIHAKDQKDDILFLGGDPRPMTAFSRAP
jgi:hypothetical protein